MLYHFARNKEATLKAMCRQAGTIAALSQQLGAGRPRSVLVNKKSL
jgi:hypothetical protein